MRTRVAVTIIVLLALVCIVSPVLAAPLAQSLLPNFLASAKTHIFVKVTLADGQTVVVPITLIFALEYNTKWGGKASLDTEVAQQPGMSIAVEKSGHIEAAMVAQPQPPVAVVPAAVVATATVAPPTVAPAVIVPITTPLPSPTPTPQISAEELAFLVDVEEILSGYSETSSALQAQFALMSNDVAVILDPNWTIKTATELATMAELNRQVNALTIPARFTALGFELRVMANLLDRAIPAITTGIDKRDATELGVGVQLVVEASAAMSRARNLLPQP